MRFQEAPCFLLLLIRSHISLKTDTVLARSFRICKSKQMSIANPFVSDEESTQTTNDSEADDTEMSREEKVEAMAAKLSPEEFEEYLKYEVRTDTLRVSNAMKKAVSDSDAAKIQSTIEGDSGILAKQQESKATVKDYRGNLPMFRDAFPVEDRDGFDTDFYKLDRLKAEKLGIGVSFDEDPLSLPIVDGKKWTPQNIIDVDEPEVEDIDGIDPSDFTLNQLSVKLEDVEDIDELIAIEDREIAGKDRSGAAKLFDRRSSELSDEPESTDSDDFDGSVESEKAKLLASIRSKIEDGGEISEAEASIVNNL